MASGETIVALSSGRLPAAIGIVRASGPGALSLAEALAGPLPAARQATLRAFVDPRTEELLDRGLLLIFPGPDSATGEDLVEFHLHGSRAVVEAMLAAATARPGVRFAEPGEFTRRALGNGRLDLIQVEGLAELLAAETDLQRRAAQFRADGAVSAQIEQWRQRLLDLAAVAEIAIDYVDEDDGAAAPAIAAPARALADAIGDALRAPRIDRLRDGFRVVLAGEPNVGKSSLINALTRSNRAIVTAIAGTTRDSIEAPLTHDGLPLILVDTAGLRDSDDPLEQLGVLRAWEEIDKADLILWLGSEAPPAGLEARTVMIHSKCDIRPVTTGRISVSAATRQGLDELWLEVEARLSSRLLKPNQLALTAREATLLDSVRHGLERAAEAADSLIASEEIRGARFAFDQLTGRVGVEQLLDALFSRFCVGK